MTGQRVALLASCMFAACCSDAMGWSFCIQPGDRIEEMWSRCESVGAITEYTEEGAVTSYVVPVESSAVTVEIDNGIVDVIRFRGGELPFDGVSLGDSFLEVRGNHRELEVHFGWEETGYLALGDRARGVYIVFDLEGVPDDASASSDERVFANASVVGVNWVKTP